jgi:hypothetical protein
LAVNNRPDNVPDVNFAGSGEAEPVETTDGEGRRVITTDYEGQTIRRYPDEKRVEIDWHDDNPDQETRIAGFSTAERPVVVHEPTAEEVQAEQEVRDRRAEHIRREQAEAEANGGGSP